MSDEIKKFREFWLVNYDSMRPNYEIRTMEPGLGPIYIADTIHVVEYSALEAAQDERDHLQHEFTMLQTTSRRRETELLNLVMEMREALEKSVVPHKWWSQDHPNDGTYTAMTYDALILTEKALAKADATLKRLGVTE